MAHDSQPQPEISGWWFAGFLFAFASLMGIMIAANLGPHAIRVLSLGYLMTVFVAGGALLASMLTNAIGLSREWEIAKNHIPESTDPDPRPKRRSERMTRTTHNRAPSFFEAAREREESFAYAESDTDIGTTTEAEHFINARRRPRRRSA